MVAMPISGRGDFRPALPLRTDDRVHPSTFDRLRYSESSRPRLAHGIAAERAPPEIAQRCRVADALEDITRATAGDSNPLFSRSAAEPQTSRWMLNRSLRHHVLRHQYTAIG